MNTTPTHALPVAEQLARLSQDEDNIERVTRDVRALSFGALCPLGRAKVDAALAALYAAQDECAQQRRRLRAMPPV